MDRQPSLFGGDSTYGHDLDTTPGPDLELQSRLHKRQQNRIHAAVGGATFRNARYSSGSVDVSTETYGLPHTPDWPEQRGYPHHLQTPSGSHRFSQHSEGSWASISPRLVPRTDLYAGQKKVDNKRVEEIMADPSTGMGNVRVGRELPYGVHNLDTGRVTVIQGHHRVSAEMAKGALFVHARVIDAQGDHLGVSTLAHLARRTVQINDAYDKSLERQARGAPHPDAQVERTWTVKNRAAKEHFAARRAEHEAEGQ